MGASTPNGVVKNFHGRIEDESYTLEPLPTEEEMLEWLFGYVLYYNFGRPDEGLGMKTSVEMLQAKASQVSPDVAAYPPVVLDRIDLSAATARPCPSRFTMGPEASSRLTASSSDSAGVRASAWAS